LVLGLDVLSYKYCYMNTIIANQLSLSSVANQFLWLIVAFRDHYLTKQTIVRKSSEFFIAVCGWWWPKLRQCKPNRLCSTNRMRCYPRCRLLYLFASVSRENTLCSWWSVVQWSSRADEHFHFGGEGERMGNGATIAAATAEVGIMDAAGNDDISRRLTAGCRMRQRVSERQMWLWSFHHCRHQVNAKARRYTLWMAGNLQTLRMLVLAWRFSMGARGWYEDA
jgi:hypothetical protein